MVSARLASPVELRAHLVEIRDLQLGAELHRAAVRRFSSPRISFSSVVLPAPFGPIRPILSPRRMVAVKLSTIRASP